MSSDYDASEFVDGDLESRSSSYSPAQSASSIPPMQRAPTAQEVNSRVLEAQQKLAELKRAQEELERERAALEDTRRRQTEFQTGRKEMVEHLTRGLGLLEEAEINARRDAEQMAKVLADFRDALNKVQAIQEETWTKDNFQVELTRALTALENARMEWNAARLKFPILMPGAATAQPGADNKEQRKPTLLEAYSFSELCRLGFALTWPVAAATLLMGGGVLLFLLLRR